MKQLLLLGITLCILISAQSQPEQKETYLTVKMYEHADPTNKTRFYSLAPDLFNKHAEDVYALVPFKQEPYNTNSGIGFYFHQDSSAFLFNYFRNQTEAMQFLAQRGWQLVTVASEIYSGFETARTIGGSEDLIYTTLSSKPVFYFKKMLQ